MLRPRRSMSITLYWPSAVTAWTLGIPITLVLAAKYLYILASKCSWGNFVVTSYSLAAYFSLGLFLFSARYIYPKAPVPNFLTNLK